MATFVDQVTLHAQGGDGGNGCASVMREKFRPLGGPDGGNGGSGGDVVAIVDPGVTTLLEFHHGPHKKAQSGKPGAGDHRHGAKAADIVLRVPSGTIVRTPGGEVLADLVGAGRVLRHRPRRSRRPGQCRPRLTPPQGSRLRAARRAGRVPRRGPGAQDRRRRRAGGLPQRGQVQRRGRDVRGQAEDRRLPLHHAGPQPRRRDGRRGRVHRGRRPRADPRGQPGQGPGPGVPAACRAVQRPRARPGLRDDGSGSRSDRRPGRHRERARALRRAQRPAAAGRTEQDRRARRARAGRDGQADPRGSAATRSSRSPRRRTRACGSCRSRCPGWSCRPARMRRRTRRVRPVVTPKAVDDAGFTVTEEDEGFRVRGDRPERWVRQTDFSNDEAVGYLADRLARLGRRGPAHRGRARPRARRS